MAYAAAGCSRCGCCATADAAGRNSASPRPASLGDGDSTGVAESAPAAMLDEEGAFDRALVAAAAAVVDAGAAADGPCWLGVEAAMVLYFAYQWG